ncbi:MAG: hypothetical protein H0T89_26525 [Deltaproteobacteria bacterium]|nr:hypothetical protein [Deltaproteobacteria bacterium]MDQ3296948.1 hypothetical protein [Myxococcota bacterium]
MSIITKSFLAATVAVSLVSCVKQDEAPAGLKEALPTAEQVRINLPEGASRTIGQLADYYVVTRDVTRTFNGGTAWVLVLIHAIVQYPVTSVNGDTYTWGPWSGALDPAEYKLDVRDVGDGTFEYQLSGKSKTLANATFEVVIDGVADPRPGALKGNGTFLLDFDAGRRVNPVDAGDERGQVEVRYDLAARHLDLGIVSVDAQGNPVSAEYAYDEALDGSGEMSFSVDGNAGGGAANEQIEIISQWAATGTGRADATATGGDIGASLTVSLTECWDTGFKRTYYQDSQNFAPAEGLATTCSFPSPK